MQPFSNGNLDAKASSAFSSPKISRERSLSGFIVTLFPRVFFNQASTGSQGESRRTLLSARNDSSGDQIILPANDRSFFDLGLFTHSGRCGKALLSHNCFDFGYSMNESSRSSSNISLSFSLCIPGSSVI